MKFKRILKISSLPFFTSYIERIDDYHNQLPLKLPYELIYDDNLNLIRCNHGKIVKDWIKKTYQIGSTGYNVLGKADYMRGEFQKYRINEFTKFFLEKFGDNLHGLDILEIGCGDGRYLYQLKKLGANVMGIDPCPFSTFAKNELKIPIKRQFFDRNAFDKKFDIIYSKNVLEHIKYPIRFLRDCFHLLKKGGFLLSNVPNCTLQLDIGDPGMMLHEHINYFTKQSLDGIHAIANFRNITITPSNLKHELYCIGEKFTDDNERIYSTIKNQNEGHGYGKVLLNALNRIQDMFEESNAKTIGLVGVSHGAINLLGLLDWKGKSVRLFEKDTNKIGKYITTSERKIEDEKNLGKKSVDQIYIMPIFYDNIIRKSLESLGISDNIDIISLKELLIKSKSTLEL